MPLEADIFVLAVVVLPPQQWPIALALITTSASAHTQQRLWHGLQWYQIPAHWHLAHSPTM